MIQIDDYCTICGLRKGGRKPVDHTACAIVLRARKEAFDASPDGIRAAQLRTNKIKQAAKAYASGSKKRWWPE